MPIVTKHIFVLQAHRMVYDLNIFCGLCRGFSPVDSPYSPIGAVVREGLTCLTYSVLLWIVGRAGVCV